MEILPTQDSLTKSRSNSIKGICSPIPSNRCSISDPDRSNQSDSDRPIISNRKMNNRPVLKIANFQLAVEKGFTFGGQHTMESTRSKSSLKYPQNEYKTPRGLENEEAKPRTASESPQQNLKVTCYQKGKKFKALKKELASEGSSDDDDSGFESTDTNIKPKAIKKGKVLSAGQNYTISEKNSPEEQNFDSPYKKKNRLEGKRSKAIMKDKAALKLLHDKSAIDRDNLLLYYFLEMEKIQSNSSNSGRRFDSTSLFEHKSPSTGLSKISHTSSGALSKKLREAPSNSMKSMSQKSDELSLFGSPEIMKRVNFTKRGNGKLRVQINSKINNNQGSDKM